MNALGLTATRKDAESFIKRRSLTYVGGKVTSVGKTLSVVNENNNYHIPGLLLDGRPLSLMPLHVAVNKPEGHVVTRSSTEGPTVFSLLPEEMNNRTPPLNAVGRLDKMASGLLLLTQSGLLVNRLMHPDHKVEKEYSVRLASPLRGDEASIIGSGTLVLKDSPKPCLPATFIPSSPTASTSGRIILSEGRYHHIRRVFGALNNRVIGIHRVRVGPLGIDDLPVGGHRVIDAKQIVQLWGSTGGVSILRT